MMTQHSASRLYSFAGFTLDAQRRLLSSGAGQSVPLPTTAFDILLYLVEHAGDVVEKSALMRAAWPHVHVEENSLTQSISVLRRALGEAPSGHALIVTVPGRGYRFVGEVTTEGVDGWSAASAIVSTDPQAYQHYVMGWSALTRPGGANLEGALQQLEQAVVRDPNFALAYVCIADCYALMGAHGLRRPHDVFPHARAAISRALEIDADLAEAHAELGQIHAIYDFDYKRAKHAVRRALEINPRCFLAHRSQGVQLLTRGEFDAALASFRRAQAVEPLAASINGNIGMVYYFAGRYEDAVVQCEATLKIDGRFDVARSYLGRSLLRLGEFARAIEQFQLRTNTVAGSFADIAAVYALSGRIEEAKAELEGLLRRAEGQYVSPFDLATVHAALKEDEAALEWLERAFEQRSFPFVTVDPSFHRLRGEPRFVRLIERLGLG